MPLMMEKNTRGTVSILMSLRKISPMILMTRIFSPKITPSKIPKPKPINTRVDKLSFFTMFPSCCDV